MSNYPSLWYCEEWCCNEILTTTIYNGDLVFSTVHGHFILVRCYCGVCLGTEYRREEFLPHADKVFSCVFQSVHGDGVLM